MSAEKEMDDSQTNKQITTGQKCLQNEKWMIDRQMDNTTALTDPPLAALRTRDEVYPLKTSAKQEIDDRQTDRWTNQPY